jgi:hypothetical protein
LEEAVKQTVPGTSRKVYFPTAKLSIPTDFYVLKKVQISFQPHPLSYPVRTGTDLRRDKEARTEVNHSDQLIVRLRRHGAIPVRLHTSSESVACYISGTALTVTFVIGLA